MNASDLPLDALRRELFDRLARTEQRTQALESMLLHEAHPFARHIAPLHETPTPAGVETPRPRAKRAIPAPQADTIPAAVIASLEDAIWSTSPDGDRVYHLFGGVERTYGRTAREFQERPGLWFESVPVEDRPALQDAFRQLPITGSFQLEHATKLPGGALRWVLTRGRLVRSEEGLPLRVDGITTNVTTRTKTERAGLALFEAIGPLSGVPFLEAAVEHLAKAFVARAAVVAIPDPVDPHIARTVATWIDGRLAEPLTFPVHGKFVRDLLAGGSQFVPSAARDRFPADEFLNRLRAESAAAAPLIDAAGRLLGFVAILDDRSVRGDPPDVRAVLRALAPRIAVELTRPLAASRMVEAESRDTSAHIRELEERLAAAEVRSHETDRLELLGRLLASVAHDLNNLLTVVTGHAELVRESLMPEDPLRETVELISSSGHTAARVAQQLLACTRPPEGETATIDPNDAVRASERLLAGFIGEGIELDLLLTPDVAPIRIDRGDFDRVLLNLVVNARDASSDGGIISVRTAIANVALGRRGWPEACPPGEYVALTVADTGCGMTDEVRARAFTRFFTTKGTKGTGLGLTAVWDIVQAAGGHVELDSSLDWGTSVRVFWPAATEDEPISLSFEESVN